MGVLMSPLLAQAQSVLYEESHKETEYRYGVVEDNMLDSINEMEKFKYRLTFTDKTVHRVIDPQYNSLLEVTLDSISDEAPWMNLARKFAYDGTQSIMYGKDGSIVSSEPFSEEQRAEAEAEKMSISNEGYHPGLKEFPSLPDSLPQLSFVDGITIERLNEESFRISHEDMSTVFDKSVFTITNAWTDGDGYKNTRTLGYTPFEGQGFLLTVNKHERVIRSYNGPCITEVTLSHLYDYVIQDPGKLIEKAMTQSESISISPNPNDGHFSVKVNLASQSQVSGVAVIHVLTNQLITLPIPASANFTVDISGEVAGHYVLRVTTSQSVLTTHFIKN